VANDVFIAVNRLLAAKQDVRRAASGLFVVVNPDRALAQTIAADLGVSFQAAPAALSMADAVTMRLPRIALADQYGGSMPSGWTRWLLEQFEFPFEVVFPQALDAGSLAAKYDVIIFPSGVGPSAGSGQAPSTGSGQGGGGRGGAAGQQGAGVPKAFAHMVGSYTAQATFPPLKAFVEAGGTILAVGPSSMNVARLFELPVSDHLVEKAPDGSVTRLPAEKYYVPGSVLRMAVDTSAPVAHGITNPVDIYFNNSPVFRLDPDAAMKGVRPVAWFDSATPLRSGWAYGQGYLQGGVPAIEAAVGKGRLYLFGPEITFRAQPHGTFKFLFNGIYPAPQQAPRAVTEQSSSRQ
jgi:hypothetical protein